MSGPLPGPVVAVVALLLLSGTGWVLVAALAMFRQPDAYNRINVLSTATSLGLPSLVFGAYLYHTWAEGFSWYGLVRLLLTVLALIVVSSVASNALARAAFLAGAPIDPQTDPNDLAELAQLDRLPDSVRPDGSAGRGEPAEAAGRGEPAEAADAAEPASARVLPADPPNLPPDRSPRADT